MLVRNKKMQSLYTFGLRNPTPSLLAGLVEVCPFFQPSPVRDVAVKKSQDKRLCIELGCHENHICIFLELSVLTEQLLANLRCNYPPTLRTIIGQVSE